jgi:hypothetical protein
MDETGWRVGGRSHWAHVAVGEQATVYTIRAGRGYAEAAELVGKGYTGFVMRDGWAPYRKFQQAFHQTCLAHLLRRCRELEEQAGAGGSDFPRAVKQVLQQALQLRERHSRGEVGEAGLGIDTGRVEARLAFLNPSGTNPRPAHAIPCQTAVVASSSRAGGTARPTSPNELLDSECGLSLP